MNSKDRNQLAEQLANAILATMDAMDYCGAAAYLEAEDHLGYLWGAVEAKGLLHAVVKLTEDARKLRDL